MNVEGDRFILLEYLNMYFLEDNFMIRYNGKQFSKCLDNGWKFCSRCRYLVNTDKKFCPICRKKFRIRKRSSKSTYWDFIKHIKY